MFDPFEVATVSIFNTSIANSSILTDANSNQHSVRVVEKQQLFIDGNGFQAPLPEGRKSFDIIKGDFIVKKGNALTVNGIAYIVDAILKEDLQVIQVSVKVQ